jgi:hypothetical protein
MPPRQTWQRRTSNMSKRMPQMARTNPRSVASRFKSGLVPHNKGKYSDPRASFMAKVDLTGSCWLWMGGVFPSGYGAFRTGRLSRAHRAAYELFVGPIPEGMGVLHRCDVRPCVSPDHFFLGSNGDNNRDRARKGRSSRISGEERFNSILTWATVREIRAACAAGESQRSIGRRFGICQQHVSDIKTHVIWKE